MYIFFYLCSTSVHRVYSRMMDVRIILFVHTFLSLLIGVLSAIESETKIEQKNIKLPPCAACRMLTESFRKGMERTERGKFEGGDTAWEEEKMGSYRKSEVRLIEVQEKLCTEMERGQNQCLANAEENEEILEEWWFQHQDDQPDLHAWLCISKLEACCPPNHYGAECLPCRGGPEQPCFGNGRCKGNGTRKGNGECDCHAGYEGALCNECKIGFFEAYKDDKKVLCDKCHKACQGACMGAGPKSCVACNTGWAFDPEGGCLDLDECVDDTPPCKRNELCINNDGSYTCLKCDRACDGCNGDGPDMCLKCADGYVKEKDMCVDNSEQKREDHLAFARYVTYAGLTVATCIIFQKHTVMAAVIGLIVASYISFSEYYLKHMQSSSNKSPILPADFTPIGNL